MRLWPFRRRRTPPPLDQDGPATIYAHQGGATGGHRIWDTLTGRDTAVRDWVRERDGDSWRRVGGPR